MASKKPWVATSCAIVLMGWAATPTHAAVEARSLGDLLATAAPLKAADNPFPNRVEFPQQFVREVDTSRGVAITLVGRPEDVQRVLTEKSFENIAEGVFAFTVSMEVAYDPEQKLFSGEGDPQTEQVLRDAGFTNIRLNRADPLQVAMLELTADGKGRKLFQLYVALADTGSVFRVTYHMPKLGRESDAEVWRKFIGGLANRG